VYLADISESINRILKTPLGSRVMRPKFGSLLYTLRDREPDESFRALATKYTFEAIKANEPRVTVSRVNFEIEPVKGTLTLKILLNIGEVEVKLK
jgi:uncharacterized protein